ncbi:type 4a pilus biogenesis protein PilO [Pelomonas sp. APW6]|uniref:Type 4a pilus biogenesis protein PilO n=1 Tax=Roseateles subflavus TaxID=3053353 RepID=A0ABT7LIH0_9BURK|nr:type 4a pilus biogenesis protein PilO [Pelomonas sp. APW6]MDL5032668.1 type 4a pilus biogenesis protein PilO [Pelomonas sp. APW6]
MAKNSSANFDLNAWFEEVQDQFRGLNPQEPGQWPLAPRLLTFAAAIVLAVVGGWFLVLADAQAALDAEAAKEPNLRQDYKTKLVQAVNLPELRKQKSQVEEYVNQLEKQLPGRAEMDALLSDINSAAVGRGLQFEFFGPSPEVVKDYYAEKPISIRVSGRYHDIGAFVADIANLSRIVTLSDLNVSVLATRDAALSGTLNMEAKARTYRYLDSAEVAEQRKSKAAAKQGAKK